MGVLNLPPLQKKKVISIQPDKRRWFSRFMGIDPKLPRCFSQHIGVNAKAPPKDCVSEAWSSSTPGHWKRRPHCHHRHHPHRRQYHHLCGCNCVFIRIFDHIICGIFDALASHVFVSSTHIHLALAARHLPFSPRSNPWIRTLLHRSLFLSFFARFVLSGLLWAHHTYTFLQYLYI